MSERLIACWLLLMLTSSSTLAGDWPRYMMDARRSNTTEEVLTFPMQARWVYTPHQRPRPAWPDPVAEASALDFTFVGDGSEPVALDFDYATHPVVAGGLVYIGSSADDTVRAISLESGELVWRYTTGGPIRFAPDVSDGRVYVASDDGVLYCLDAATGEALWTFRAAPADRMLMGNGRLISRWPLRSGVLVMDDTVYVTAGMWPADGVAVYELDAKTGVQRWINDTCAQVNEGTAVDGAYAITGVAPQGYLLAHEDTLVVPTGRSIPSTFSRADGTLIHFTNPSYQNQVGGHWATISPNGYLSFGIARERFSSHLTGLFQMRQLPSLAGFSRFKADRVVYAPNSDRLVLFEGRLYRQTPARRYRDKLLWYTAYENERAHCMVLADNTLLIGGDRQVLAVSATDGSEIWRATDLDSQVRSIAVADGHILAATDSGRVYVYGTAPAATLAAIAPPAPPVATAALPPAIDASLTTHLGTAGIALVLGDGAGAQAASLLARSRLQVILLVPDAEVPATRHRLAGEVADYGVRLAVYGESALAARVLPDYAFDYIIANRAVDAGELASLYRVLSPCGGLLALPAAITPEMLVDAGTLPGEAARDGAGVTVTRGPLPGAFDWNTEYRRDKRVKWPLELLWFGEPGPSLMQSGGLTPIAANGRNILVARNHIICLDAYSGTELWRRNVPYLWRHVIRARKGPGAPASLVEHVSANDDTVYFGLVGRVYELSAQTGSQRRIYGSVAAAETYRLDAPVDIVVGHRQAYAEGKAKPTADALFAERPDAPDILRATVRADAEALVITMQSGLQTPSDADHVELFIDARPPAERNSLYGDGVFHVLVHLTEGRLQRGAGTWHPEMSLDRTPEGSLALRIPWSELSAIWPGAASDFCLAMAVNHPSLAGSGFVFRAQGRSTMRWYWSCDDGAYAMNNGWARFTRSDAPLTPHGPPLKPLADLRPADTEWTAVPPIIKDRGWVQERAGDRVSALSLGTESITFVRGKGCGLTIAAESLDVTRSGTLAFYDMEDDSGIRHFGGVRASCSMSMLPALGVVLASEGSPTCSCNYNFKCTLALAPAAVRRHEDWAVYKGVVATGAVFKAGYFNVGAPGDRRDDDRRLWLQYPRPPVDQRVSMAVPVQTEGDAITHMRVNADRVPIAGTDRPWIFASCVQGITRAEIEVYISDNRAAMSFPVTAPPVLDATLDEPFWDSEYGLIHRKVDGVELFLRHDDKHLYVGSRITPRIDRLGKVIPWQLAETESTLVSLPAGVKTWTDKEPAEDVNVWENQSFELYFTDQKSTEKVLHLGLSITGTRMDGIATVAHVVKKKDAATDLSVSLPWHGAMRADDTEFVVEYAIPWTSFDAAGLDRDTLMLRPFGRGLVRRVPHPVGGYQPIWVAPTAPIAKSYRVRLHFAELADLKPGERVFDIKIQGKTVATDVDIVRDAGDRLTAHTLTFEGIVVEKTVVIEFVPKTGLPILSGLEMEDEALIKNK